MTDPRAATQTNRLSARADDFGPIHLYRVFDPHGLIYVGRTAYLHPRLRYHCTYAWWAPTVVKVRAVLIPTLRTARLEETRVILTEQPRYNLLERGRRLMTMPEDEYLTYAAAWLRQDDHHALTCACTNGRYWERLARVYAYRFGRPLVRSAATSRLPEYAQQPLPLRPLALGGAA